MDCTGSRELAGLVCTDPNLNPSIVTSIEFDKDGKYLAMAGVSKKIKVCLCACVCVYVYLSGCFVCVCIYVRVRVLFVYV